jgi:hypothetical protein
MIALRYHRCLESPNTSNEFGPSLSGPDLPFMPDVLNGRYSAPERTMPLEAARLVPARSGRVFKSQNARPIAS